MTQEDKIKMREIIAVLQRIDNGEKFFLNVAQYEKFGLITARKKWGTNAVGNKVEMGYTFHLTDKARRFLSVII